MLLHHGMASAQGTPVGEHPLEEGIQRRVVGQHAAQLRQEQFRGDGVEVVVYIELVGPHGPVADSPQQVDNGIPVLRSIPWLGPHLFGSKTRVKEQREIIVFVTVGLVDPNRMKKDAGLPKNAVLGRQYVNGQKIEPGDKFRGSQEGIESLDLRPLNEQALDPLATNAVPRVTFLRNMPF